jgi:hypothetical protein
MIPKKSQISVQQNGELLSIVVHRSGNTKKGTLIKGNEVTDNFYKPYEKKISEKYFREKCLPDMIKFGKMFLSWGQNSVGIQALSYNDPNMVSFFISEHVDENKNKWIKNPSKKTIETFELLNKLTDGPEIRF